MRAPPSLRSYEQRVRDLLAQMGAAPLAPREGHYMSCSPLQVYPLPQQQAAKAQALAELVGRPVAFHTVAPVWGYRMRLSFSVLDTSEGPTLAWYVPRSRGQKQIPAEEGCLLAPPLMNKAARVAVGALRMLKVPASLVRCVEVARSEGGAVAVRLVVEQREGPWTAWHALVTASPLLWAGVQVGKGRHRSPTCTIEEVLVGPRDVLVEETVLGVSVRRPAFGFVQNHRFGYEGALIVLADLLARTISHPPVTLVDMYAGVGTIGLVLCRLLRRRIQRVVLIESDHVLASAARIAASAHEIPTDVCGCRAEEAMDIIQQAGVLVVDPPRSGLHPRLAHAIRRRGPPVVAYLSCSPATFARDLRVLTHTYALMTVEGFDFYPHTPHAEVLGLLVRRQRN